MITVLIIKKLFSAFMRSTMGENKRKNETFSLTGHAFRNHESGAEKRRNVSHHGWQLIS